MATRAKATTAKTSTKKVAAKTAASDSPAKKATTSKKPAETKTATVTKAVKTITRKTAVKPVAAKNSANDTAVKKTTDQPSKAVAKPTRAKATKATEKEPAVVATKTTRKTKATVEKASADKPQVAKSTRAKSAVKTDKAPAQAPVKKAKSAPEAAKEATTEKITKTKAAKAPAKAPSKTPSKVAAKVKSTEKAKVENEVSVPPEASKVAEKKPTKPVETKAVAPEQEVVQPVEATAAQEEPAEVKAKADLPKTSTQKAFEAAAEIAPLVQSHKSNGGTEVNAHEAQKAAEYLMNTMATKHDEHIVIDGITIPTQAELLEMPEEDYMNERQQAFFKWLLKQRESELKSNAGQTTENLRESTIAPDPADRATIEEEHALELRTRDRERKLLKKVQEALRRLEKGEFGWCEETGEPIGIPRLLARPTATLSLEAQQRREQRQKLYGD